MMKHAAFTLIELLIVVAIIGILAAIAVPNFLQAMTRSKVSRTQADMRSIATALEAYALDHGRYPPFKNPNDTINIRFLSVALTTPVAYLNNLPPDAFAPEREGVQGSATYLYAHSYAQDYLGVSNHAGHVAEHFEQLTGEKKESLLWQVWSFGPDLDDDHGVIFYDISNGVNSDGDMLRFGP